MQGRHSRARHRGQAARRGGVLFAVWLAAALPTGCARRPEKEAAAPATPPAMSPGGEALTELFDDADEPLVQDRRDAGEKSATPLDERDQSAGPHGWSARTPILAAVKAGEPTSKTRRRVRTALAKLVPFVDMETKLNDPHKHRDLRCARRPEYKTAAAGAIIEIKDRRTAVLCSAVAISPRRVATAAHCLWEPSSGADHYFTLEEDAYSPGSGYKLDRQRRHGRLDLATVDLAQKQASLPAVAEPSSGLSSGQLMLKVGYGVWSQRAPDRSITSTIGDRTCAIMKVTAMGSDEYTYDPIDPPAGQVCSADSGGPALVLHKGKTLLLGITVRSPQETDLCGTGGTDVRISPDVARWLETAQ